MHDATISDETLLERFARERDRSAAGELAERYRDLLYDLTLRILRDPADAGDATQSAFLNALRGAAGFRRESSVKTWLYGIAIRESLRIRDRRQRQRNLEAPMDAKLSSTGPSLDGGRSAREAVEREVAALPEHERLAVVLHYWRGLSYGEAAEALGCAAGTVGSRLAAARERLKTRLGALGFAAAVPNLESLFAPAPLTQAPPAVRQAIASALSAAIPAAAVPAAWAAWTVGGCAAAAAVASAVWLSTPTARVEKSELASASIVADAAAPPAEGAGARQDPTPRVETTPARAGAGKSADAASAWGTVRIAGVVKDQKHGLPIEGADVGLYRIWPPMPVPQVKGFPGPTVETDKNGAYRFEDSPGGPALYRVELVNPSDALSGRFIEEVAMTIPNRVSESVPAPSDPADDTVPMRRNARLKYGGFAPFQVVEALVPREARADLDVVYRPSQSDRVKSLTDPNAALVRGLRAVFVKERTPSVFGVVQAEDGSHPEGVQLRVFDKDGMQDWTKTVVQYDVKSGEFVAGPLPPSAARVEAVHAELGYAVARDLPVSASGPTDNVVLTLRAGSAKFAGVVVNVEGRPVEGARVTVFVDALLEGAGWIPAAGEATTGKDGAFEIPRAGAQGEALRLRVHAAAYRDFETRGAAGDTGARLVVKPKAFVRGKLVAKDTGLPLRADPMKFIFVDIDVTPSSPLPSRFKGQVQTAREALHLDASGGFAIEGRPGRNDVRVQFDGYKPFVKLGVVVEEDGLDLGAIELERIKK